jgi:hypothetical protein
VGGEKVGLNIAYSLPGVLARLIQAVRSSPLSLTTISLSSAFSAVAPRERPAWLTVRAAKQLKRTYFVPSPQTAVTGLRSPVVWGAVIVVQLTFPVTIVPIVGTIARESWGAAQLLLGDIGPVPA